MKNIKEIIFTILISIVLYTIILISHIINNGNALFIDIILILILLIIYFIKRRNITYNKKVIINDVRNFIILIISSIILTYLYNYISIKYILNNNINSMFGIEYSLLLYIITFNSNFILVTNLINIILSKYTKLNKIVINILSLLVGISIFSIILIILINFIK